MIETVGSGLLIIRTIKDFEDFYLKIYFNGMPKSYYPGYFLQLPMLISFSLNPNWIEIIDD